ncbi:S1C family serine protease [Virgibacillus sp. SK37]|uniref:S1C family serine protease n=1 Tax=Virgibacillus sp. SK37 TaxID=403957 RepID=UPI0004D14994|nr:trypsin-like peptidase domain-containing protein [Virgibacillus sp. SK37]AIF42357.1 serine protease [Virgibacillus sp. SK37]
MDYNNNNFSDENKESSSESTTEVHEHNKEKEFSTDKPKKEVKSGSRTGLHFFLGGLAGGLIAVALIAVLLFSNILPLASKADENTSSDSGTSNNANVVKTMASDQAEVASNIDETSKAVVGVANLQQQSVWSESQEAGTGSGIVYKKEDGKAYVVTNHHVVEGAEQVDIILNDDERLNAKVLGSDSLTDLAILQVDGDKVTTVADLGTSKNLKVGETVLAIGNPLGMEFANTLTKGIISGLDRSVSMDTNGDKQPDWVTEVIQTDAAINPGNSGGALVNAKGQVIGINSMKIAQNAVEGIGFAIPIDSALPVMEQLEENGEIERPLIGISTASLNQVPPQYRNEIKLPEDVEGGMVVANVQKDSPAAKAGLQQFDVITEINDNKITSLLELRKFLYSDASIGEEVQVKFYRDGKLEKTEVTLTAKE